MRVRCDLGLVLFLALAGTVAADIPTTGTTIFGNGTIDTPNRIQLLIVGDGWEASHLPKYQEAANKLVENLFKHSPYKEYKHCFVVTRVDVTTNVSGTNRIRDMCADPTNYTVKEMPYFSVLRAIEAPPGPGFQPNTNNQVLQAAATLPGGLAAFQGKLVMNGEHAVPGNFAKAQEAVKKTLDGKRKDMVLIMVHDAEVVNGWATFAGAADPLFSYIGYGWDYGRENDPANIQGWNQPQLWGTAEVLAHEIGHALFDLKDEYGGNAGPPSASDFLASQVDNGEIKSVNVTLKAEGKETWKRWKNAGLITGPVQGGATYDTGVWRAEQMCKMNVHHGSKFSDGEWEDENPGGVNGTHPLAPVCTERAVQQIYSRVSLIDKAEPGEHFIQADDASKFQSPAGQNTLRVTTLGSSDRKITAEWYLDGQKVPDDQGLTRTETDKGPILEYKIDPAKIPPGYHFVWIWVQDRSQLVPGRAADADPIAIMPPFFRLWMFHVEAPSAWVRLKRRMGWGDD